MAKQASSLQQKYVKVGHYTIICFETLEKISQKFRFKNIQILTVWSSYILEMMTIVAKNPYEYQTNV
jgi:hypothetical protein